MALKDKWKDLEDKVQGDPDSGSDISVTPINEIAHAVIDLEEENDIQEDIIIDTEMSDTSKNAVQNKVIKKYVDDKTADIYEDVESIGVSVNHKEDITQVYNLNEADFLFLSGDYHNADVRMGETSSITFVISDGVYPEYYISGLTFDSGATPTALNYSSSRIINWVGTDCTTVDGLSIFQPSANTHYDIVFYFNGTQFIGLVNGFVPATGNVVSE